MGELDDEDNTLQGSHALDQYGPMMNDFLAVHATAEHAHEGGQHYDVPDSKGSHAAASDEAAVAIAKVRCHQHACTQSRSQGGSRQYACSAPAPSSLCNAVACSAQCPMRYFGTEEVSCLRRAAALQAFAHTM